jgi:transcriptional regulator with XRE-family HTH domain
MADKALAIRKMVATNIKRFREMEGLTQENLAEKAGISTPMMCDIEGCRTWISDKTLARLSTALKIETYRLFIPDEISGDDASKLLAKEITQEFLRVQKTYNNDIERLLKKRGLHF